MIAKLLICADLNIRKKEIFEILASHLESSPRFAPASTSRRLGEDEAGGNINHPDLLYFASDSKLGVESAKKIKEHFSLKPYSAKGRAVVLEDGGELTPEAQNALLKTIEELGKDSLFIIGASSESKFLPTILSRCQIVILNPNLSLRGTSEASDVAIYIKDIDQLLRSTIEQRFEYIEKLKEKQEFLYSLVDYFHQNLASHLKGGNGNVEFLKDLLQAEEWAKQNVNIRAILEYLMLKMPSKEQPSIQVTSNKQV